MDPFLFPLTTASTKSTVGINFHNKVKSPNYPPTATLPCAGHQKLQKHPSLTVHCVALAHGPGRRSLTVPHRLF